MILDLAQSPIDEQKDADVVIVGAGTVGLVCAVRLQEAGRRVLVLESGGLQQADDVHPLNEVVQLGAPYDGATNGRFRCLGGTSTRWGGAMAPFREADFDLLQDWDAQWPVGADWFTKYRQDVEDLFHLANTDYEIPQILGPGEHLFTPRLAKWPPFADRNVAALLKDQIRSKDGPEIWLNAHVVSIDVGPNGRVASILAKSAGGRGLSVKAPQFVLAAGAIECTRLLLLLDRQNDDRFFAPHGVLGRYFHDHISVPTARLRVKKKRALNRITGFRFEGRTMRNLRFEPAGRLRKQQALPSGFLHIAFNSAEPGGFDALRSIFRARQEGQLPPLDNFVQLAKSLPWLTRAVWWRLVEKRLLFPSGCQLDLHTVVEQEPLASNRIGLSDTRHDGFGTPLATITWRVTKTDMQTTITMTEAFCEFWKGTALASIADIVPSSPDQIEARMGQTGGIYHPGGSTRMGHSPSRAVVDKDLQTFAIPNLSVLSTSVFPTGGGCNPTMMLLMATMRLAEKLSRDGH